MRADDLQRLSGHRDAGPMVDHPRAKGGGVIEEEIDVVEHLGQPLEGSGVLEQLRGGEAEAGRGLSVLFAVGSVEGAQHIGKIQGGNPLAVSAAGLALVDALFVAHRCVVERHPSACAVAHLRFPMSEGEVSDEPRDAEPPTPGQRGVNANQVLGAEGLQQDHDWGGVLNVVQLDHALRRLDIEPIHKDSALGEHGLLGMTEERPGPGQRRLHRRTRRCAEASAGVEDPHQGGRII